MRTDDCESCILWQAVENSAFFGSRFRIDDYDQAFFWCDEAYKEQSAILQWIKVHPLFDPVRSDPRFEDLLRRVGLDQTH